MMPSAFIVIGVLVLVAFVLFCAVGFFCEVLVISEVRYFLSLARAFLESVSSIPEA